MANLAVLTSGGDSPGMNAAISTVARCAAQRGLGLIGLRHGFNGLTHWNDLNDEDYIFLGPETGLDIADRPGTFLKTGQSPALIFNGSLERAVERLRGLDVSGLVVIGGEGSLAKACRLADAGVPCVGIPGTIANDLAYTEATLGYDTAVNVCADVVSAIRATSRSHDRPHVVEVMGRHCGDIALETAMATGSEIVLCPEAKRWNVEEVAHRRGRLGLDGSLRRFRLPQRPRRQRVPRRGYERPPLRPGAQLHVPHARRLLPRGPAHRHRLHPARRPAHRPRRGLCL